MDVLKKVSYISKHIWLRYQIGCTQKYKVEFAYHAQGWGSSPATKIPWTKIKVQSKMGVGRRRKGKTKTQRINHFNQNGNSTLILTQGNIREGAKEKMAILSTYNKVFNCTYVEKGLFISFIKIIYSLFWIACLHHVR